MSNPDDRSRVEDLIARAERVTRQPVPESRARWVPVVALGLIGVVAIWIGVSMASNDDSSRVAPAPTTAVPPALTTAPPSTTIPVVITLPPATVPPSTAPTTAPSTVPPAPTTTQFVDDPLHPVRWADYTGGQLLLLGEVPDQITSDALRDRFAAVFGADHVVVEHTVVAGAPTPDGEPLLAHDSIQFAPNSITLDATAQQFLDLVVAMMEQNPQTTLDVRGYTDGTGPADANLELSQARVDTVTAYLAFSGIDPARLMGTGFGKAYPIADDSTPEGRALNRRVEFTIHHLLD